MWVYVWWRRMCGMLLVFVSTVQVDSILIHIHGISREFWYLYSNHYVIVICCSYSLCEVDSTISILKEFCLTCDYWFRLQFLVRIQVSLIVTSLIIPVLSDWPDGLISSIRSIESIGSLVVRFSCLADSVAWVTGGFCILTRRWRGVVC